MKEWKTSAGNTIVRLVSGGSNVFLLKSLSGNILFDTGKKSARNQLLKNIALADKESRGIKSLILTHTHFDHCQNAAFLKNKYTCDIVAGSAEAKYTREGYTPIPDGTYGFTKFLTALGKKAELPPFRYEPFEVDRLVEESLTIKHDRCKIIIISTPAHSQGSVTAIIDGEIAIAGDALFSVFPGTSYPPFADDPAGLENDWKKLLDTGAGLFLPGHGNEIPRSMLENELNRKIWIPLPGFNFRS